MSVISDLIEKVNDPDLRARLSEEVARMQKQDSLEEITEILRIFNHERDWEQFHDAKNLALSISIEAAELNECFLWKNADEADRTKVEEELADVFLCAIMLADKYDINVKDICMKKIERNAQKYPVEKAKGKATKYDEL
jgi:NTP pyrophosphatase (non-canonical NTP hydrolase)